jgi:acyl dehydratase
MAVESVITDDLRDLLGKELEAEVFPVEKGHILRFAQAIDDPNPLYCDLAAARNTRHQNIIAPPAFLIDAGLIKIAARLKAANCPLPNFLNGGTEIEYLKPIKAGDTITTTAKLVDLQEKAGQSGPLILMKIEVEYKNQNGDTAVKCHQTFIKR